MIFLFTECHGASPKFCGTIFKRCKQSFCKQNSYFNHRKPVKPACLNTFKSLISTTSGCNNLKEEPVKVNHQEPFKEWKKSGNQPFYKRLGSYSKLSKARLTALVTLTASAGYIIAPGAFVPFTFAATTIGTFLCSASANSFNQLVEVPYDCQMIRTQDRVLVRGMIRPLDAAYFGAITGLAGFTILASAVNMPTACLGLLNIILYSGVYTISKRIHIANTWIGSVVGAIPPMMGWLGRTGGLDMGALILAGVVYSWQFPHFNSLSWNYRPDYSRAGYKMMAVTDPALCRRVTLRHSVAQIPLSIAACLFKVTNWSFLLISLPVNFYLSLLSWEFYRNSNNNTARKLFKCTLWHLPVIMVFFIICKYRTSAD